jgi:hypothetical protein
MWQCDVSAWRFSRRAWPRLFGLMDIKATVPEPPFLEIGIARAAHPGSRPYSSKKLLRCKTPFQLEPIEFAAITGKVSATRRVGTGNA